MNPYRRLLLLWTILATVSFTSAKWGFTGDELWLLPLGVAGLAFGLATYPFAR